MNRRMIVYMVGQIFKLLSLLLLLPTAVSFYFREKNNFIIFLGLSILLMALGFIITAVANPKDKTIFAKEGFIITALSWLLVAGIGALPFYISREIPSFIDALFESVSGFTTTGASILTDVEAMSKGLLFWRSFSHWVGGMGVLVMIMAILPLSNGRSIHIIRAEVPGPTVGKLVAKMTDTAKILYIIYFALTVTEVILLRIGGMSLFESLIHSFGTAGTGGFGIRADSIASYSKYIQWVITIFMAIFGINFNLYYLIILGKFKTAIKSVELWCYIGIIALSTLLITINILPKHSGIEESVRLSAFQVTSLITTTGYSTADFNQWPVFSKTLLLLLMFIGGCAGSTAGGIKVSRLMLMVKAVKRNLRKMLHPRSVNSIKFEGKIVEEQTINNIHTYMSVYVIILAVVFLILSVEPFGIETNLSATISCFNNIGPGLGNVGPMFSYTDYSPVSTFILSITMLLGRLEIFPLLFFFSPSAWSKNK